MLALLIFHHSVAAGELDPQKAQELVNQCSIGFADLPVEAALIKQDSIVRVLSDHELYSEALLCRAKALHELLLNRGHREISERLSQTLQAVSVYHGNLKAPTDSMLLALCERLRHTGHQLQAMELVELLRNRLSDSLLLKDCDIEQGAICTDLMQFEKATVHYHHAIERSLKAPEPDTPGIAKIYMKLAITHSRNLEDHNLGLRYIGLALNLLTEHFGPKHSHLLIYRCLQAAMLASSKRCDEAQEKARQLVSDAENMPGLHTGGILMVYERAAGVHSRCSAMDSSIPLLKKAIRLAEQARASDSFRHGCLHSRLGSALRFSGDFEAAQQSLLMAEQLGLEQQTDWHRVLILSPTYYELGALELDQKNHLQAAVYFHKSLQAYCFDYDSVDLAKNPVPKEQTFKSVMQGALTRKAEALIGLAGSSEPEMATHYLQIAWKCFTTAYDIVDEVHSEIFTPASQMVSNEEFRPVLEGALNTAHQLFEFTGDASYIQRAFVMHQRMKAKQLFQNIQEVELNMELGVPDSLTRLGTAMEQKITLIQSQLAEAREANDSMGVSVLEQHILSAQHQLDSFRVFLFQEYPGYYTSRKPDTAFSARNFSAYLAAQQQAGLAYFIGDSSSFVFALVEDQIMLDELPHPDQMEVLFTPFRKCLIDFNFLTQQPDEAYSLYTSSAHALYQALFPESVQAMLQTTSRLLVFPDGLLHDLPFGALLSGDAPKKNQGYAELPYLINSHVIAYSESALLLNTKTASPQDRKPYLGMAPEYDGDFLTQAHLSRDVIAFRESQSKLWGNQEEVNAAHQLLGGHQFLGSHASEQEFKASAGQYQVLHLAMHALADQENPWFSKLIFSKPQSGIEDGFLHAFELYGMKLSADLAVLSACHSGTGRVVPGEGSMTLARAFRYAGCPSVVMSLWQAEDQVTATLMNDFFRALNDGSSKDRALSEAKRSYLMHAGALKSHPFFWSNFLVIGNPSAVHFDTNRGLGLLPLAGITLVLVLSVVFILGRKKAVRITSSQRD